jgi:type IV pilus assembly protein PilW
MMQRQRERGSSSQRGFSLIELLISMVIGLVVIGAMMAAYLGTGISSRNSRALAQITEDASVALNVLRGAISMTGYARPTRINPDTGEFDLALSGATLMGCDADFRNLDSDIATLACGTDTTADAIAVAYQADEHNSVLGAGGNPLDCLGAGIPVVDGIWVSYSRFYVTGGQLMCQGPGANAPAALVENVQTMQIRYGVGDAASGRSNQVVRYEDASDMTAEEFLNTVSVRLCVLISSADQVMDQETNYLDCDGNEVAPGDKKMYRAFTSTIVLQNRLEGMR